MADEKKNHIVEEGGKFRLLSHDGKNLGTFDTREEAEKREGQVEYFKHDENRNSTSQFPRMFYCRHMQPGNCRYDNETVLVDTDAIKEMLPSAIGKPVYIHHQKVALDTMKEKAAGYITEAFYNELDGWAWFKFIAIDDEAHKAVNLGWSVSNAYIPNIFGGSGTKNNCPYDREIKSGEFTHLAIVPVPRYEEAKIMSPEEFRKYQDDKKRQLSELQNSKPEGKTMFSFLKKDGKTIVKADGEVDAQELLNAIKKNSEEEEKMNDDSEVDVDGEKMPLKELKNRYAKMNSEKRNAEKRNAEDEEKKKKEKEEEEKKNAEKAEEDKRKKEEEDEEKTNAKFFDELKNAHTKGGETRAVIESPASGLKRGIDRYGSK